MCPECGKQVKDLKTEPAQQQAAPQPNIVINNTNTNKNANINRNGNVYGGRRKKRHGLVWWLCIGWWYWLCIGWWLEPIKWILGRRG